MNHRLNIVTSMTPRTPLALIAVRLPSITGWGRKNFVFTPLALIFRHARETQSRSMTPITYVTHGGETVVIAPRINLSIQWAKRIGDLLAHGQPPVQRSQREYREILSTPYPMTKIDRLALVSTIYQQDRKKSGRILSLPSVVLKSYLPRIGALAQWELKRIREQISLSSITGTEDLRLRSVDHPRFPRQMPWTKPMNPLIQHDPGANHVASSVATLATKSYLMIYDAIDQQIKRDKRAAKSISAVNSMHILNLVMRKKSAPDPVKSHFVNTLANNDVKFTGQRKITDATTPSLRQRRQDISMISASYIHLPRPQLLERVALLKKVLERFRVPKDQRHDLKLSTHKNSVPGSIEYTFLNAPISSYVQLTGRRNKKETTMPSLHQRHEDKSMILASYVHMFDKPLALNIGFNKKFLSRNLKCDFQSMVQRQVQITASRFLTKSERRTLVPSAALFNQPARGAFRKVDSIAGSSADMNVAPQHQPATDHGYTSWSTVSSHFGLNNKKLGGQRKPSVSHERSISSAEVVYRTEKSPSVPSSVTVPSASEPAPAQPPQIDIDRLSRDVWRQLEKRIRIERERHGRL